MYGPGLGGGQRLRQRKLGYIGGEEAVRFAGHCYGDARS
jgi:hypothetical protein